MTIKHTESNHVKISVFEAIEIMKVAIYQNILNDVINVESNPF